MHNSDEMAVIPKPPPIPHGTVKLFHASGVSVLLPVPCDPDMVPDYKGAYLAVSAALDAGWLVQAPGLEAGEEKEMVGWVVKRTVPSRNGTCPRVYLYLDNEAFTRSHVSHYLNTAADIQAFEQASGLKIDKIPAWPAGNAPERGKEGDGFIIRAPKPFGVVFKLNPEFKEGDKDKTKRLFVRWDGQQQPTVGSSQQPASAQGATIEDVLAKCKQFIASDPPVDVFNRFFHDTLSNTPTQFHPRIWSGIRAHAKVCNWEWVSDDPIQYKHGENKDADPIPF